MESIEKSAQGSYNPCPPQRWSISPFILQCCRAIRLSLAVAGLLSLPSLFAFVGAGTGGGQQDTMYEQDPAHRRVPLDVHIESMCPDARDCLQKLVEPAYWQVKDKVHLGINYVGEVWGKPIHDVTFQHGWNECAANKLLVCANKLSNTDSNALGFTTCVLSDYQRVSETGLIQECAKEHNLDYERLKNCAGTDGLELLTSSVGHSVAVGANFSCTIRVDGKEWCKRDDYKWLCDEKHYTISSLVKKIKKLAGGRHDGEDTDEL